MKQKAPANKLDPITLEVAWRRLITIMDEVDVTVVRTSFSSIIGAGHDFACVLLDERGYSLAESTESSNLFTVMLPRTTRHFLEHFGRENIYEGDIYITNDPWLGSGHLPDLVLVSPIFYEGRLVAFLGTVGHIADIGGNIGYHDAREIYEEGLQIPPLKLFDRGQASEELFALIAQNVRVPDMVIGDLRAFVSAHSVGQRRLREFMADSQFNDLKALAENIHYLSERAMRRAISAMPEGVYRCAVRADGFDEPLDIVAAVTIDDGQMHVDLEGSSEQMENGAINCTLNATLGDILIALKCSLVPDLPNNEGLFQPVSVNAPKGSIFNCRYPSAVKARSKTAVHTHEALYGALAEVIPHKVQAGSSSFWIFIASGADENNRPFSAWLISRGAKGAIVDKDGVSCVNFPSNGRAAPAEILENHGPILIERKEFNPDSAGAGRYRGGFGQRVVISSLSDKPVTITLRPNNVDYPAPGLLEGKPGVLGTYYFNQSVPSLAPFQIQKGQKVTLNIPGSGGAGDPLQREVEFVLEDVRQGLISPENAREDYGVVVDPQSLELLEGETASLREQAVDG